jgi:hypothetical protein
MAPPAPSTVREHDVAACWFVVAELLLNEQWLTVAWMGRGQPGGGLWWGRHAPVMMRDETQTLTMQAAAHHNSSLGTALARVVGFRVDFRVRV